ncbi:MAG: hypothetical protein LM573_02505 [Thermofilum sp.]|nr:hypothetical protein [Thermofilum sp.]
MMKFNKILTLAIIFFISYMFFYAIARFIYFPWPQKFALFSSLVATSFSIFQLEGGEIFFKLRLRRAYVLLILFLGPSLIIIFNLMSISHLALPFALVYGTLVPGISLIKVFNLVGLFDDLSEFFLFSFSIGVSYLGSVTLLASLLFGFPLNRYILDFVFVLHILHIFILCIKNNREFLEVTVDLKSILFLIIWLLVLYIFFSLYYPSNIFLPGLDIVRHYIWSINLIRNPWKFLVIFPDNYIIFHAFEGGIMLIANCFDATVLNASIIIVSILHALALAQLSQEIIGKKDVSSKYMALLYYFIFSGLGYLYIFINKPTDFDSYFNTLIKGNEKLHRSLMYMPSRLTFMWPTPQAFSITVFLLLILLMLKILRKQYKSSGVIILSCALFFAMMSSHPPQALISFLHFLFLLILFGKEFYQNLKQFSMGLLLGSLWGGLLNLLTSFTSYLYQFKEISIIYLRIITFLAPPLIMLLVFILVRSISGIKFLTIKNLDFKHRILYAWIDKVCRINNLNIISVFSFLLLFSGILVSLDPSNKFTTSRADPGGVVGIVPWFIYIIWLGALIPLGLRGFIRLIKEGRTSVVVILGSLGILSIMIGRIISYLNASGIDTGYWGEQRFVLYLYLSLAPPAIYELKTIASSKRNAILVGFLSAFLAINSLICASYWGIVGDRGKLSDASISVVQNLSKYFWANPDRWLLTPSLQSREISLFSAPIYYVYSDPSYIWKWQVPELSLSIFNVWSLDPPYIYINWTTDSSNVYFGWIGKVLLSSFPKVFQKDSVDVYAALPLAPPLPNGSVVLVIPTVQDELVDEAYLLLSLSGVNYTSVLEIDPALYSYGVIMVPYDPLVEIRTVTVDLLKSPITFTSGAVKINVNSIELGGRPEKSGLIVWRDPFYLSPELLNITVRFEVREYNPETLNYFFFVYDFKNETNYKYAGVMFTKQGQVYALNCSLVEGEIFCSPPFPGVLMGKVLNVTGEHLMRVSLDAENRRLCLALDSLDPVCFISSYAGGQIGLRTVRFWLVSVKTVLFEAKVSSHIDEKKLEAGNYILFVLTKELDMPFKNSFGNTRIFYINIGENSSDLRQATEFIREILHKQKNEDFFFNREQYFRKVSYSNLVTNKVIFYNVTTTSSYFLIIPQGMLKISNSSDLEAIDARYIVVSSLSGKQLNLYSDFAIVKSGLGFYVTAGMKRLHVPRAKAFLYLNNGNVLELKGDLTLEGELTVIARRPLFIAEQAKVNGVVGQSLLYPYIARDLLVRGNTTFLFLVGDSSLLYFVVNADRSKVSFIPPLDIYSEWESVPLLVKHLPLSVVLTVLIIGGFKLAGLLKKSKESV